MRFLIIVLFSLIWTINCNAIFVENNAEDSFKESPLSYYSGAGKPYYAVGAVPEESPISHDRRRRGAPAVEGLAKGLQSFLERFKPADRTVN